MYDKLCVRRIFNERARIVVYLESRDVERMERRARQCGMTMVEWAREVLLVEVADKADVHGMGGISGVGRGITAHERAMDIAKGLEAAVDPEHDPVVCEHGAEFARCKKWGCKFYEVVNGRR